MAKITASLKPLEVHNYKPDFPQLYQNPWVNGYTALLFRKKVEGGGDKYAKPLTFPIIFFLPDPRSLFSKPSLSVKV